MPWLWRISSRHNHNRCV
ncbi:hypothetical protein AZE42_13521 [Rhizopogon vesiculosus]|uniref:Uncharacterized protein n=1 Tax=Rhizopogon vesiculosus TaxID=180088 RepID=A0A1J8R3U6_9AGAM|nr:hypothetical protein AZE42_13521 [Rhizopogon vesiculosus]